MGNRNKEEIIFDRWVWLDLEMTGLDEKACVILQAAMIITNPSLDVLAETEITIWQPESAIAQMVPIVKDMHTQNKLLEKVRASKYSLKEAEAMLLEILTKHVPYGRGVLTGNSIYVDRMFLQKYMPIFEGYLYYRQIDISSIKLLAKNWYRSKADPNKKPSSHTALSDVKNSIEELKYYRDNLFIPMQ